MSRDVDGTTVPVLQGRCIQDVLTPWRKITGTCSQQHRGDRRKLLERGSGSLGLDNFVLQTAPFTSTSDLHLTAQVGAIRRPLLNLKSWSATHPSLESGLLPRPNHSLAALAPVPGACELLGRVQPPGWPREGRVWRAVSPDSAHVPSRIGGLLPDWHARSGHA